LEIIMSDFDFAMSAPPGYTYADVENAEIDAEHNDGVISDQTDEAEAWEYPEPEAPAEEVSSVPEALVELEAPTEPVAPSDVRTAPETAPEPEVEQESSKRTHQRGGAADFGGLRQSAESATSSANLFAKLLEHGTCKVMIDGEAAALDKARPGVALDKRRKVAKNRIINRILKGGGFERKYGSADDCVQTATINAQTMQLTLLKPPAYLTLKGRPTNVGKVAQSLANAGKTIVGAASDAELDRLLADEVDSGADSE
jgi:hypothetical protein